MWTFEESTPKPAKIVAGFLHCYLSDESHTTAKEEQNRSLGMVAQGV